MRYASLNSSQAKWLTASPLTLLQHLIRCKHLSARKSLNMKLVLKIIALALPVSVTGLLCSPMQALAYPAMYINSKSMGVGVQSCMNAANNALTRTGFSSITTYSGGLIGGVTDSDRGAIVCVQLPRAGSCPGTDGATAVMVVSGDNSYSNIQKVFNNFYPPVTIDCGSVNIPVQ